jgi:hypothetical protein
MHLVATYVDHLARRWIRALIHLGRDRLISRADGSEAEDANAQPQCHALEPDKHKALGPDRLRSNCCTGGLRNNAHIQISPGLLPAGSCELVYPSCPTLEDGQEGPI